MPRGTSTRSRSVPDDASARHRTVSPISFTTEGTGGWLAFVYDEHDRVVEVAASTGATTRMRYDGAERSPAEIVDAEGGVTCLTVVGGLVHELVDPDGPRCVSSSMPTATSSR